MAKVQLTEIYHDYLAFNRLNLSFTWEMSLWHTIEPDELVHSFTPSIISVVPFERFDTTVFWGSGANEAILAIGDVEDNDSDSSSSGGSAGSDHDSDGGDDALDDWGDDIDVDYIGEDRGDCPMHMCVLTWVALFATWPS